LGSGNPENFKKRDIHVSENKGEPHVFDLIGAPVGIARHIVAALMFSTEAVKARAAKDAKAPSGDKPTSTDG
jgi:hypothetical protein